MLWRHANSSGTIMLPSVLQNHAAEVGVVRMPVRKVHGHDVSPQADALAIEEPLEIRVGFERAGKRTHQAVSITMRTPGHDRELAAGFLWTEGVLLSADQIHEIRPCGPPAATGQRNVVRVELRSGTEVNLQSLERHFYTTSSCGVCGKTALEAVRVCRRVVLPESRPLLDAELIHRLPDALRAAQAVFDHTGGLHGAGLFDERGELLCLREDVGRHNAVDKVIGTQLLAGTLPLSDHVLFLSGRASFELVQKAMMAGIAVVAAVGAPSSLAVDLARDCGMTVLGFVRNDRFNIYSGEQRIREARAGQDDLTLRRSLPVIGGACA